MEHAIDNAVFTIATVTVGVALRYNEGCSQCGKYVVSVMNIMDESKSKIIFESGDRTEAVSVYDAVVGSYQGAGELMHDRCLWIDQQEIDLLLVALNVKIHRLDHVGMSDDNPTKIAFKALRDRIQQKKG